MSVVFLVSVSWKEDLWSQFTNIKLKAANNILTDMFFIFLHFLD